TVTSGTGAVTFTGAVGSEAGDELAALVVNSTGQTLFSDTVEAASVETNAGGTVVVDGGSVDTTGTQTYNEAMTLGAATVLTGSTVTTKDVLAGGNHSLQVDGNAVFGDSVNDTLTGLTTLDVTGTTTVNTGTVTTSSTQDYADTLTLGEDVTLTGSTVSTAGTIVGVSHSLLMDGHAVIGDGTSDTVTGLTSLEVTNTSTINTDTVTTSGTQTFTGAVTLGATTTLTTTDSNVLFSSTLDSVATEDNGLIVAAGAGDVTFSNDIGKLVSNTQLGSIDVTATNISVQNVTSSGTQAFNGTSTTHGTHISTDSGITFSGDVVANEALMINTGAGAGTITFTGTVDSEGGENNVLSLAAGTGNIDLDSAIGATDALAAVTLVSAANVGIDDTLNAASLTQTAGSGTTTISGDITTSAVEGIDLSGTNLAVNAALTTSNSGTVTLDHSGVTTLAAVGDIDSDGAVSITATGGISTAGDITTSDDDIALTSATTLTGDVAINTGTTDGAISFGSTVDGDGVLARNLRLTSGAAAGQNFAAAVGNINSLNLLRIESSGVVTQSALIKAAGIGIKSAGNVTLNNAGNDIDVLAALLSGDADLVFVDSNGVQIGTVDTAALQIVGISDGADTSNVTITVGGLLDQAASSPIDIDGNLIVDTTSFDADDVDIKNIAVGGTELDNSLVAGDFNVNSVGDVSQIADANGIGADAWLKVGGNFNVTGAGSFVQGNSADNLIGSGSAGTAANEIRLYGVISLSMDGGNLVASATTTGSGETSTDTITAANLASGVVVTSDAGVYSISAVGGGSAITLNEDNNVAGTIQITTKGTYSNSGTPVVTGIIQTTDLELDAASFLVQQSATNVGSGILGAGLLDLSNETNTFSGTVSATAIGMDIHIREDSALELGTVNGADVTIELADASTLAITQNGSTTVTADNLILRNAGNVTFTNNNRISTLAANLNGDLVLNNNQALSVGVVDGVDGVTTNNSDVTLQTLVGDLTLDQAITVPGSANITLVTAANFINNVGVSALTIGTGIPADTGIWQVWSSDPALDTIGGLLPDYKQYNAIYGSASVAGTGNGLLYTLAPELTVTLTGTVERIYNSLDTAALVQSNYNVSGLLTGDSVVLSTAGTYDNKNVGTDKTITVDPLSIVSASANAGAVSVYGYQLSTGSDSINADIGTITPAALTLSGITADNKVYNADVDAMVVTGAAVYSGLLAGDVVSVSTTGVFSDKNVADSKTVTLSSSYSGADTGNYSIT
ncbi:MAG: hypothetical protein GY746_14215, partial [Gammaproteobacteria bacterium]|nr:hypothetical protein [Gammaproteobacteria bacterium]